MEIYTECACPVPSFAVVDLNNQVLNNVQSFVVPAGESGTTTVNTVVSDGFAGAISLQAVNLLNGITASFNPSTITGFGVSQVTFSLDLSLKSGNPGNYSITVAGASEGVTKTTTVALTVGSPPAPNFKLDISPSTLAVNAGRSGAVNLTITPLYGFNSFRTLFESLIDGLEDDHHDSP